MQKISGLGRGLGSLIPNKKSLSPTTIGDLSPTPIGDKLVPNHDWGIVPEDNDEFASLVNGQEKIVPLPVDKISPNPHQPRNNFSDESLRELTDSIKEHGIIQPLIVTQEGDGWQLIAGERRWRAAKALKMKTIPAIVRDMTEQKKLEIALIENLQRQDLNALETAAAYRKLIDEFNLTQEQLAKRIGKSRPAVTNTIRILSAAEEVKQAILEEKITAGHARVLAGLPKEDQLLLLQKIIESTMNVRETERASRNIVIQKHIRNLPFYPDIEAKKDLLQEALATKVEIKKSGGTGQIIIKFYSEEELESIFKKIVG